MKHSDHIKEKIEKAIDQYKNGLDLSSSSTAELLESINIYHQELEYQNDELKRTILKLEESEAKYQDLFENAPISYVIFDYRFKIREANLVFCEMMRVSKEVAKKKRISDFIHPEDQDSLYFFLRNLTQKNLHDEIKLRAHNGLEYLDVLFKASTEVSGGEYLIRCALIDKTKESRFLEEITLREERFEQVTSLSGEIIWETDPDGFIVYANKAFVEETGYTTAELIGTMNVSELLDPEQRDELSGKLRYRQNDSKSERRIQHKIIGKPGKEIWVQTEYVPVFTPTGMLTGYRGISHNISDVKMKIHDLMLAEEAAHEMTRMKNHFLSSMSHEIRNPLVAIIGAAEMLGEMLEGNPDQSALVDMIFKSSIRLRDTVSMILNLNRFEKIYSSSNVQTVDLRALLTEIVGIFSPFASRKGLKLSLVSEDAPVVIQTSEVVILSVINNLVNNAIKYTDEGEVVVALRVEQNEIIIEVSDTGIGIAGPAQDTIWEEFKQEDGFSSLNQEGSGFGLSLVKKYVELMGAEIHLYSVKGKGSKFTLRIPAH